MQLIDVLNKLREIENPTKEVKEAIEQAESMTVSEDMDTVAAIINDIMDHDPSDESVMGYISKHSDKLTDADYKKLHAELSDMGYDAEVIADLIEASEDMVAPEMEPDMAVVVEPEMALAVEPDMQNKDEAVDMAHGQLEFIKYAAQEIEDYLMRGMPLPEWMQNKLSRMHGNIMNLHAYIEGEEGKAGLNESVELAEGQYDGKSREELLKMKAQAEADIKNMQSSGDGSQQKFYDETQMMMAQQHLDDINNALKKVGEDVNEASGEFAQPFYDLLDDYAGGESVPQPWETIIDSLVGYMSGDEIADFVDTFRREHDMNDMEESIEAVEEEAVEETVEIPVSELQDLLALAGLDASIEEWANTPTGSEEEPVYGDAEEQLNGLSGGLNRQKEQFSKGYSGDNEIAAKYKVAESLKQKWDSLKSQDAESTD